MMIFLRLLPVVLFISCSLSLPAQSLEAQIDELMQEAYPAGEPGAAIIITKNGKPLLRKGYGMADLELDVPVQPQQVFRLGSITKQFTAVAILQLVEAGKLELDAPVSKYLPDFPKGDKITIHQLLTHTSGLHNYTAMPEWASTWRQDLTTDELLAFVEDEPLDFEPGSQYSYSNSGYLLLGRILEEVSGQSYGEYLQEHIFGPLEMNSSHLGSYEEIIPGRVEGYTFTEGEWQHAAFLSMTHPGAAGALLASVDDLAKWDAALYTDQLLPQERLQQAWQLTPLTGGDTSIYGYGWAMANVQGSPSIEHTGGINGFSTAAIRMPKEQLYVAILTNRDNDSPHEWAVKAAAIAMGKPYEFPEPVTLSRKQLEQYVGVYEADDEFYVTLEGDQLVLQRSGGSKINLSPASETLFFYHEDEFTRFEFVRSKKGKVVALLLHTRSGKAERIPKTDKPLPAPKEEVTVPVEVLEEYVGVYQLAPTFMMTIERKGNDLIAQATGQQQFQIFPSSQNRFFLKVVDAEIEFQRNKKGEVTGMVLYQGGREVPGKKVK